MRQHRVRPRVDAFVERFARRHQSDFQCAPAFQRRASRTVHFRNGFPRKHAHFDRTDQFLLVRRRDFSCRFGVQPRKQPVQVTRHMLLRARAQPLSQFFGALWHFRQSLKQRPQIQSRADGKNRQTASAPQIFQNNQRHLTVSAGGRRFIRS